MMLPADLTTYLVELAYLLGYDIDLDTLESVTGLHTELVIAWAEAGGHHATLAHTRAVLAAPIAFLRANGSTPQPDQHLLAHLLDCHQRYDEDLDHASQQYADACHALTGTGLVWPRTRPTPPPPPRMPLTVDHPPSPRRWTRPATRKMEANHPVS